MKDIELDIEDAEEKKDKANTVLLFISSLDQESIFIYLQKYYEMSHNFITFSLCSEWEKNLTS